MEGALGAAAKDVGRGPGPQRMRGGEEGRRGQQLRRSRTGKVC